MKMKEYSPIENGARLAALRGERSLEEVAAANNISVSALSMYEAGGRNPRDSVKLSLASYYGVTVSSIFYPNEFTVSEQG